MGYEALTGRKAPAAGGLAKPISMEAIGRVTNTLGSRSAANSGMKG